MCAKYLAVWYRNEYRDQLLLNAKAQAKLRQLEQDVAESSAIADAKFEKARLEMSLDIEDKAAQNVVRDNTSTPFYPNRKVYIFFCRN